MARYDKYDPYSGGFRAPLAADWAVADYGVPFAVGLDANGRVVKGAGNSGIVAVLVVDGNVVGGVLRGTAKLAGDIVDCMTSGEIVDCAGLVAGDAYGGTPTGPLASTAGLPQVGHTVEAGRLVVRVTGKAVA